MKVQVGVSKNKNANEAVNEAMASIKDPSFIVFISQNDMLRDVAAVIKEKYSGLKSIGTSGISYHNTTSGDDRLIIIGFDGDAVVETGVLRNLSSCPIYDINNLENAISKVGSGNNDTVCIEFCTNSEERLVTTLNVALKDKKIPLAGATVFGAEKGHNSAVVVNGDVYEDACAYALIRNKSGKIRTYSEVIYKIKEDAKMHVATKVNVEKKELISLDGKAAASVYSDEMGIPVNKIVDNVLSNPIGRIIGDEIFVSSPYEIGSNNSLINYKQINENDTVAILELGDYAEINRQTRGRITGDGKVSFVLSFNCIYRHLLFENEKYLNTLLQDMGGLGSHVGYVAGGEQYMTQHVNQTMACVIFE